MSLDRRIREARAMADDIQGADPMTFLTPKLMAFAQGTLRWDDAVGLLGEAQLDQWRHRLANLVRWQRFHRIYGFGRGAGEAIQTAIEIASYSPTEDLPQDYSSEIDRFKDAYLSGLGDRGTTRRGPWEDIDTRYLVYALLATCLLEFPDGMPLRRWLDEHYPGIWSSDPDITEPPGYDVAIVVGGHNRPKLAVRAINAFEEHDPDAEVPAPVLELIERWKARQ